MNNEQIHAICVLLVSTSGRLTPLTMDAAEHILRQIIEAPNSPFGVGVDAPLPEPAGQIETGRMIVVDGVLHSELVDGYTAEQMRAYRNAGVRECRCGQPVGTCSTCSGSRFILGGPAGVNACGVDRWCMRPECGKCHPKASAAGVKTVAQTEPVAWLVYQPPGSEYDYKVYANKHEADNDVACQDEGAEALPLVLAAGVPPARAPKGQRGHIEVEYGPLNWIGWATRIGLIVAGIVALWVLTGCKVVLEVTQNATIEGHPAICHRVEGARQWTCDPK